MSSTDILKQQIAEVAQRRAERDALAAELKDARAAFEATLGDKAARLKGLAEAVAMSEDAARKLAEAIYATTQEKKPCDGVQVKVGTVYEYDPKQAFAWAQETKMALIPESLDVKAFEKIAKATPLPFVTEREEGKAQLATDLSAYLPTVATLTPAETEALPF